ncbi:MAG: DUF3800 domain-containing protein [Chloroflexota bacterium]|nr:DUF3800 domain-containing protein [Chloroflexota bacterium]
MFLDESGNHGLTTMDEQYPVFVLSGVIADLDYAETVIESRLRLFKRDLFERDDICLHTADIVRNKNGFERIKEPAFRQRFYVALNTLMHELDYKVVACAIKNDAHLARYGMAAVDPYMLSLDILVERFCFEIGDVPDGGVIYAEKRSPVLDRQLDIAWLNLKVQGTGYVPAKTINSRLTNLHTRSKEANVAGLQLADLVVSPIGRFVLGKPTKEDWTVIEEKFRRRGGSYHGAGLVVLPR